MDDLYQEHVLDHYRNPRHFGELKDATITVRESNSSCGDLVEISLKVEDEKVSQASFRGVGCAISTATTSILLEKINQEHWNLDRIMALREADLEQLIGIEVTPTRKKCLTLSLRALHKAVAELTS